MAHFAEISGSNNIVVRVIVTEQDFINSGAVGDSFNWVQTSYNHNFRKNYAGIGYTYDEGRDAFISPQPFPSWILNEDTCRWVSPVSASSDEIANGYVWDEDTTSWVDSRET